MGVPLGLRAPVAARACRLPHLLVMGFLFMVHVAMCKKDEIIHFKYPDILMIGAMKAGTTSLSNLMRANPAVCDYGEKEKHFFNGGDYVHKYAAQVQKYIDEFKGCKKNQLTLDSTPGYSVEPNVNDRMKETYLPEVLAKKYFIYLVREPVARHYSEYQMEVRLCLDLDGDLKLKNNVAWRLWRHERACDTVMSDYSNKRNDPAEFSVGYNKNAKILTFHEWCLSHHGKQELRRGHYKTVIMRYLDMIRRDQFLLVNFDKLISKTAEVMVGMNDFLNLQGDMRWKNDTTLPVPKKSAGNVVPTIMDCVTTDMLIRYFNHVNGGGIDSWIRNMTLEKGKPKGEIDFGTFSDPLRKCVKPRSNDSEAIKAAYPAATWTFIEDSIKFHSTNSKPVLGMV